MNTEPGQIDLSDNRTDFHGIALTSEDVAVIAVPSYSGRVPVPAVERIMQIRGNGAKAILVCVYGNRAYEDTLIELQDCVQSSQQLRLLRSIQSHDGMRQTGRTRRITGN